MNTRTQAAFGRARDASARAYERGRVRTASLHAVTFGLLGAGLSVVFVGAHSLVWIPLTMVAWAALEWRGMTLLRGARIGALAGAFALALPLSVLRRCCKPGALESMGLYCCSMPGACAAAGAVIGLALACGLPLGKHRGEAVCGMVMGIAAVAPLKCGALLVGEALGLVGGLLAGLLAAIAARAVIGRIGRSTVRS